MHLTNVLETSGLSYHESSDTRHDEHPRFSIFASHGSNGRNYAQSNNTTRNIKSSPYLSKYSYGKKTQLQPRGLKNIRSYGSELTLRNFTTFSAHCAPASLYLVSKCLLHAELTGFSSSLVAPSLSSNKHQNRSLRSIGLLNICRNSSHGKRS